MGGAQGSPLPPLQQQACLEPALPKTMVTQKPRDESPYVAPTGPAPVELPGRGPRSCLASLREAFS